ncbi:flagellar basal body P-ring formation chaperone FlgA [Chromobacterium sp. IIBBL 290-4]|uniref:flagellar basal body P-ring formation chaperone FlgA n=1 Tax=Chromobacterium sp. IIBBL 290-4 TaxID=2953890 RepID=UPI0020B89BEA|nr:flagellar basal body P-ring formation chaperone FlgA [Chromobacterium sp. IIBBL 290-4]UTH72864.1 flagellar basal body P-ring formation chaperone FlgA [Chromobacterium sp. IIBBL 290-4]
MAKFTLSVLSLVLTLLSASSQAAAPLSAEQSARKQAEQIIQDKLRAAGLDQPVVQLQMIAPANLPNCAGWQTEAMDSRGFSRMRIDAVCPSNGWRGSFIARATVSARVAVANRDLQSGETLSADDIAWAQRPVSDAADLFGHGAPPAGLSPRAAIKQGQTLRKKQLQAPLLVKRGDEVRIIARQSGIEVSAAGEAMANGQQGETIKVRNQSSGKIISSKVEAEGQVMALE